MTWSYDLTDATDRDRVRLLIGDTDPTDGQLQDEEIDFLLTTESGVLFAAAAAADAVAARCARQVDYSLGRNDITESLSQRRQAYLDLAARLRQQGVRSGVRMIAGGLSLADKSSARTNPDAPQPFFRRDMETEPGTEPPPVIPPPPVPY